MNIERNSSFFNTDGLTGDFASFDDNMCNTPAITSRKSQDVIFRSDFPGSKKITILNQKNENIKPMAWDDLCETNMKRTTATRKPDPPSSFVCDTFTPQNDGVDRFLPPKIYKQRITLSGGLTKAHSKENSQLPMKTKSKKMIKEEDMNKYQDGYVQAEPFDVSWCRAPSSAKTKGFTDSSQASEVTSTTSATSRSLEGYDVAPKVKQLSSGRCVSRSRTVGALPSKAKYANQPNQQTVILSESLFPDDFEVNWPEDINTNRETLNLKQIRDTPTKSNNRNATPKRAASTSRSVRRDNMIDVNQLTEPMNGRSNRRSSLDNGQYSTPSKIKPRLYMAVALPSPRKKDSMKSSHNLSSDTKYSNNKVGIENFEFDASFSNLFDDNRKKTVPAINSEPLDFSEFDTEDFSSHDDLIEGFSMPFKPVEPLYYTSSNKKHSFR